MLIFLQAALATPTHAQMEAASWSYLADRAHDDAGRVKVYSATIAGVTCFKATATTADADAKTMLDVVTDVVGAKRWSSAGVTKAEILGRAGNTITYYQYLDVPSWTFTADRYWFLESEILDQGATKRMRWKRMDPSGPFAARYNAFKAKNPDAVEPPINVGSWTFTRRDFGVDIEYMICTDAGGSIPSAIQSAATRKTLPDTVGDVVREAKRRLGRP